MIRILPTTLPVRPRPNTTKPKQNRRRRPKPKNPVGSPGRDREIERHYYQRQERERKQEERGKTLNNNRRENNQKNKSHAPNSHPSLSYFFAACRPWPQNTQKQEPAGRKDHHPLSRFSPPFPKHSTTKQASKTKKALYTPTAPQQGERKDHGGPFPLPFIQRPKTDATAIPNPDREPPSPQPKIKERQAKKSRQKSPMTKPACYAIRPSPFLSLSIPFL